MAQLSNYAAPLQARFALLAKELYWQLLKSPAEAERFQLAAPGQGGAAEQLLLQWRELIERPLDESGASKLAARGESLARHGVDIGWLLSLYERAEASLQSALSASVLPDEAAREASRLLRKRVQLDQMLTFHGYQRFLRGEADNRHAHFQSMSSLYATLSGVGMALADGHDIRAMLQSVCEVCVREAGLGLAWVGRLQNDGQVSLEAAAAGDMVPLRAPLQISVRADEAYGGGLSGRAVRSKALQVANDVYADPALEPWRELFALHGVRSALVAPLQVRQQVVGTLSLYSAEPSFFNQSRLALLDVMAREVGRALERHDALERSHRAENELAFLARHDALTGLPNRDQMQELIDRLLQTRHDGSQVAVLSVAVEGFHEINARLGFEGGDMVLCEVSRRLRQAIYPFGHVGRVSASRFTVCTDRIDQLPALVSALKQRLPMPVEVMGAIVELRCSIGVVMSTEGWCDAASLLRRAGLALNRAREHGGGHCCHYDAAMDEALQKLHALRSAFSLAIPRGELALHYQPKINLLNNRIEGAEALVRWVRDGRPAAPGDFLPAIENTELMRDLDWWVMREAVRQVKEWREQGLSVPVSVNLSSGTLKHDDFLPTLEALLDANPLPTGFLELEVLESVTQQEAEQITTKLERCRDLGLSIALDDFGTGASSLVHLQQLPFDTIKIDQRFVRLLLDMPGNEAIIRSMVSFAHYTGRKLVVEGVESQAIWNRLLEIGCHDGQGYGISPPLAASAFRQWVQDWHGESLNV
ncbi:EAL domain-containing protein [Chromobacterium sp. IIBBL 290-4]|nr:EAL domain-containing protein [Chromobacterium sp. IIBBL 290-4]UTH73198.1 EAL domain-containing protein [Chromobacterium sp. IIBBL 290-4]